MSATKTTLLGEMATAIFEQAMLRSKDPQEALRLTVSTLRMMLRSQPRIP